MQYGSAWLRSSGICGNHYYSNFSRRSMFLIIRYFTGVDRDLLGDSCSRCGVLGLFEAVVWAVEKKRDVE